MQYSIDKIVLTFMAVGHFTFASVVFIVWILGGMLQSEMVIIMMMVLPILSIFFAKITSKRAQCNLRRNRIRIFVFFLFSAFYFSGLITIVLLRAYNFRVLGFDEVVTLIGLMESMYVVLVLRVLDNTAD